MYMHTHTHMYLRLYLLIYTHVRSKSVLLLSKNNSLTNVIFKKLMTKITSEFV